MRVAVIERSTNHRRRKWLMDCISTHHDSGVEIACFASWEPEMDVYEGIPEISISSLKEHNDVDAILIAIRDANFLSRLSVYLEELGLDNIYVIRLFTIDMQLDFLDENGFDPNHVDKLPKAYELPYLVHMETEVCGRCNLNCKACNHCSPFVKNCCATDVVDFEKDLRCLSGLFSNIGRFFLAGGEPLLEPELLLEMIRIFRCYFPKTELRFVTNCILVPKMSSLFWEIVRKNEVIVQITFYPSMKEEKRSEVIRILEANHVSFFDSRRIGYVETFCKYLTLEPGGDILFNNNNCPIAGTYNVQKGIVNKCVFGKFASRMASALGCEESDIDDKSAMIISEETDGRSVIRRLNEPCEMCNRCSCRDTEDIPWQSAGNTPDPADWLVKINLNNRNATEDVPGYRK